MYFRNNVQSVAICEAILACTRFVQFCVRIAMSASLVDFLIGVTAAGAATPRVTSTVGNKRRRLMTKVNSNKMKQKREPRPTRHHNQQNKQFREKYPNAPPASHLKNRKRQKLLSRSHRLPPPKNTRHLKRQSPQKTQTLTRKQTQTLPLPQKNS